ncbi:hypothetical protein [Candidatus Laterigemmans baculatus]|uniref:hypothetical protein n=1 Tax=Candidatus Laterigemmans baculatus TaxID=2770505 RepID=UPI0013DD714C|nr:hypothetical protein [Candidatus Laterigemmans baculatus]
MNASPEPPRSAFGLHAAAATWLLVLWLPLSAAEADAGDPDPDPRITWARTADPPLELGPIQIRLPEGIEALWLKALRHSESDLRREAADSVTRVERMVPEQMPISPADLQQLDAGLREVLETPGEQAVARTAAAQALVAIDARGAAELLTKHARRGPLELSLAVEPALARWDFQPARELWLERLGDPATPATLLHLSIDALGEVAEPRAIPELSRLVTSPTVAASTRLTAAKALARLPAEGLVEMSRQLAAAASNQPRLTQLLAVHLLAEQSGEAARELLVEYAASAEPTVAAQAMERLLEIAPAELIARAATTIQAPDARIRHLTVRALGTEPAKESIERLGPALDDRVPAVRQEARRVLLRMAAQEERRRWVVEQSVDSLAGDAWRGIEQAILILVELDQKQVGRRLLELLEHPRPEVRVAAAWGLKSLAVPELSPAVFEEAQRLSGRVGAEPEQSAVATSLALAHLLEALGRTTHRPAEAFLQTFIPKSAPYDTDVRTAAIWALGHLGTESPDPELARQLQDRLTDHNPIMQEAIEVRAISAVSLGRMQQESALPALRQEYGLEGPSTYLGRCCGWAIEQLTGEPLPDPAPRIRLIENWPLRPL